MAVPYPGFAITLINTKLGRVSLDELSARRRDILPLNTQHSRQTLMPPAGFEPTIRASERPQIHAFDRAASAHYV
jgi:hypothetical protein